MRNRRQLRLCMIDQIYRYNCSLSSSGIVISRRRVLMTMWNKELTALIIQIVFSICKVSRIVRWWQIKFLFEALFSGFRRCDQAAHPRGVLAWSFAQSRVFDPSYLCEVVAMRARGGGDTDTGGSRDAGTGSEAIPTVAVAVRWARGGGDTDTGGRRDADIGGISDAGGGGSRDAGTGSAAIPTVAVAVKWAWGGGDTDAGAAAMRARGRQLFRPWKRVLNCVKHAIFFNEW